MRQRYVEKMDAARKKHAKAKDNDALNERIASLVARCENAVASLEEGRAESQRLLLEQFGKHLEEVFYLFRFSIRGNQE